MLYLVTGMSKVRGRQKPMEVTHLVVFSPQLETVIERLMTRDDIGFVTLHRATNRDLAQYQREQERTQ